MSPAPVAGHSRNKEINEMDRYKVVEIQMERKHNKQGKAKQLPKQQPEQPNRRQTRVLRKRDRARKG